MPSAWLTWWSVLCAATVINIMAWCYSAWLHGRREAQLPADVLAIRRRLLLLSAVYVLGCGFRSVFPMVDVPRICLHDTWLSRIVVGRLVATVAELCFAAQWALLLRELGSAVRGSFATSAGRALLPIIIAAELFSWDAVLTTNNFFHAIENSLWTLAAMLSVAGSLSAWPRLDERSRRFVAAVVGCGTAYIAFMVVVDVPMYLYRWQADLAMGHDYLTLREG